ncbi:MAG: hypothetical protein NVSMB57_09420 [Actinomycetota bacterium]
MWIEGNASTGIRARITHTLDATGQERTIAHADTPEEILSVVRQWVEDFIT